MNKGIFFGVLVVVLLGGGGVFFFVQKDKAKTQTYANPVIAEPKQEEVPQEAVSPQEEEKASSENREVPKKLDVSVKEKVSEPTPSIAPTPAPEPAKTETKDSSFTIVDRLVGFGYSVPKKARSIDTVVLHSSYNALGGDPYSVSKLIDEYKEYGVSAHYLIDREGGVYRLVADQNVAYHAGTSKMPDGRTNVNDFSIGIELMNTMEGKYTDAEYTAVNALIASLKKQYPIKHVVGHTDIAPGRKTDPWNFDWKRLK